MRIRNLTLVISLAVNICLAYCLHKTKALEVLVDEKVAAIVPQIAQDAFDVGCQVAIQGIVHKDANEVDYPLYESWCAHNAKAYGQKK